jgi:Ca-activated chloride channel family protein
MTDTSKTVVLRPCGFRRLFVCAFIFSLLFILLPPFASGQQTQEATRPRRVTTTATPQPPAQEDDDEDVLRIDTDLVSVDVMVTDEEGRPVRGLNAEQFKLYEDDTERPISFFNVQKRGGDLRPIAVVFALDVSGSMTVEEIQRLRAALQIFSQRLSEYPSLFAVMAFGMEVKTIQGFTNDPQKLDRALERLTREPSGLSTHTYDAVDDAIRLLVRKAPRTRERRLMKRAVVVVTDGFPVGDTVEARTVIERANAADVSIYTVTLPSFSRVMASAERRPLPTPLDVSGLVEKTGGTNIYATDKDFATLFRALAEEVTSTYVLAFYPPEENRRDGRFHTIRVEGPPGFKLRQSRPGYKNSSKNSDK